MTCAWLLAYAGLATLAVAGSIALTRRVQDRLQAATAAFLDERRRADRERHDREALEHELKKAQGERRTLRKALDQERGRSA